MSVSPEARSAAQDYLGRALKDLDNGTLLYDDDAINSIKLALTALTK